MRGCSIKYKHSYRVVKRLGALVRNVNLLHSQPHHIDTAAVRTLTSLMPTATHPTLKTRKETLKPGMFWNCFTVKVTSVSPRVKVTHARNNSKPHQLLPALPLKHSELLSQALLGLKHLHHLWQGVLVKWFEQSHQRSDSPATGSPIKHDVNTINTSQNTSKSNQFIRNTSPNAPNKRHASHTS